MPSAAAHRAHTTRRVGSHERPPLRFWIRDPSARSSSWCGEQNNPRIGDGALLHPRCREEQSSGSRRLNILRSQDTAHRKSSLADPMANEPTCSHVVCSLLCSSPGGSRTMKTSGMTLPLSTPQLPLASSCLTTHQNGRHCRPKHARLSVQRWPTVHTKGHLPTSCSVTAGGFCFMFMERACSRARTCLTIHVLVRSSVSRCHKSNSHCAASPVHLRLLHHVPSEQKPSPEFAPPKARVETTTECAEKRNHRPEQKHYHKPAKQRVNQKSARKLLHGAGTRLKAQLLRRANADESQPLLDGGGQL